MAESIEELSFRLTTDELAEQERALSTLRTCAGTVLAAASVAGSFLAVGTSRGSLGGWAFLAMTSFALCVASTIWVLLPHTFVFAFRGEALLRETDRGRPTDAAEVYRAAAAWIGPQVRANRDKITGLAEWLTVSCVLLAVEVILWTLSFAV